MSPPEVVKSDWTGPRGGRRVVWEIASHVEGLGLSIEGDHPPFDTKREAIAHLKSKGLR